MPNPLAKLVNPRYPSTALGFEKGIATMVQLERGRGGSFSLRRAATVALPESLIRPSFEGSNISDPTELTVALLELATSAGLLQQKRWSVALPESWPVSLSRSVKLVTQIGSSSRKAPVSSRMHSRTGVRMSKYPRP